MFAETPIDLSNIPKDEIDAIILRYAMVAELDAINFYEQMARYCKNENVKKVLLDVAREEKTHVGEFQYLLLENDAAQKEELLKGKDEVNELLNQG